MQAHCPFHINGNVHFTSGSPIPPLPFAQEKEARHVGASLKSQHLLPWWLLSSEDNLVLIMAGLSPISHDFSFLPVTLFPRLPRRFSHMTPPVIHQTFIFFLTYFSFVYFNVRAAMGHMEGSIPHLYIIVIKLLILTQKCMF